MAERRNAEQGRPVPAAAWIAVVVAVAAVGLAVEALDPHYFLRDDNASYFLPVYVYDAETLRDQGSLAHVNPHQYLGQAHLASGQSGVLYPPVYLAHALAVGVFGDARPTIEILAVLHLVAAGLGMLWLLRRRFAVATPLAVAAALAWATLPFAWIVGRSWIFVPYAAAYLPWSLLALESMLRRPGARRSVVFAAVHAFFFLQGYVQYVVLTAVFQGVYVSLRGLSKGAGVAGWWRDGRRLAVGWLLATAFAAPLLGPMLHAKEISAARAEALTREEFLSNALDLGVFVRAQVFDMAKHAVHRSSGALFYLGPPLLLAAAWVGVRCWRRRRRGDEASESRRHLLVAWGTAFVALVLSTQAVAVLHPVPLLGSFRWPFKSFLFVGFFVLLGVALGLGEIWRRRPERRRLALAALALAVLGNVALLAAPDWNRPFGPNGLPLTVGELRAATAERLAPERGRVVSMWMSHGQEGIERFLTHDFATLAGAYHLGGYDPLVAERNFRLAKGLEYSNIWRYELNPSSLAYLSTWSVRYFLVPDRAHVPEVMARFPEVRLVHREEGLRVYENGRALPFAYWLGFLLGEHAREAPAVELGSRGVRVDTAGQGGLLRLQVAPLPWMEWWADGVPMGQVEVDDEQHLVLRVPEGTRAVEVRFVDRPFRIGVGIAALALLVAAWWMVREGRSGRGVEEFVPSAGG